MLCKSCHHDKTKHEQEDGTYVRIVDSESSFNNQVKEVFDSELNKHYAFIERMNENILCETKDNNIIENNIDEDDDEDEYDPLEQGIIKQEVKIDVWTCRHCQLTNKNKKFINDITCEICYNRINYNSSTMDYDTMMKLLNEQNQKIEIKEEEKLKHKLFSIDINKCRKNILYYSKYNYPVFTVMDEIKPFIKENFKTQCAWLYVETKNYFPLRCNGWYSFPLVEYCINQNIITYDNIKFIIEPSLELNNDYYNGFIDECYNKNIFDSTNEALYNIYNDMDISLDQIDFKKLSINSMIGGFKPNINKNIKWKSICITCNSSEAYEYYLKEKGCFIKLIESKDKKIYYHVFKEIIKTNIETEQPIYDQIIDIESIELHKLSTIIKSKGGKILDLKTDCISCVFPDNVFPFKLLDEKNLCDYYWDCKKQVPKYKIEECNERLCIERMPKYKRDKIYDLNNQKS